jgi:ketosteroid isomerase-like protein
MKRIFLSQHSSRRNQSEVLCGLRALKLPTQRPLSLSVTSVLNLGLMLVVIPLFFPRGVSARLPKANAESEIRAVLDAQVEAWNRGDIDTFMQSYWNSNQTEFVGSSGIQRGWQAVLARYQKTYPDRRSMGKVTFSDLEFTMLCPTSALVVGKYQLEREADRPSGVFTLVFRKFPAGWRIINDHTSAAGK